MAKPLTDTTFAQTLLSQVGLASVWRRVYHKRRQLPEHVLAAPTVINPKTLALENQRTLRVRLAGRKRRESAAVRGTHAHLAPPTAVWPIVVYQKRDYIQVTLAGRTRREMPLRGAHSRLRAPAYVAGSELPVFSTVASAGGMAAGAALAFPSPVLVTAPKWRFVLTTLTHVTLSFLDNIAINKSVVYTMNKATVQSGVVASDNPEVNIAHTDGDPFLAEGNRFLLGFRREGLDPKWVIRSTGIVLQINDTAGDQPKSTFTAFDPWQYLYSRPCRLSDGSLPGEEGMTFSGQRGDEIAHALIRRTIEEDGSVFTDIGAAGGTAYYGGTMQATPHIDITFAQGTSVGEALTQLADDGSLDIYFSPIYDPFNRPGIISELNIFNQMGSVKYGSVMAWDKPGRNLTGIDRMEDGTLRANVLNLFRANSLPVGQIADAASYIKYGRYFDSQTFPAEYPISALAALAAETLLNRKVRNTTIRIDPAPEVSPVPFAAYFIGDTLPLAASRRLRKPLTATARVYTLPIDIDDNSVEHVNSVEFSADSLTIDEVEEGPIPPVTPGFDVSIVGGTEPGDTLSVTITPT